MNLHTIVLHRIDKKAQERNPKLELGDKLLPISTREIECINNIKQAYYNKSNPIYGVFDSNTTSYPFQTMLRNYIDGKQEFLQFTSDAMKHLSTTINVPLATGGDVIFAHYSIQSEEFVMTLMLNSKKQYSVNNALGIEEILALNIEKIDVANVVNITRWNNRHETYLSFARGRKEVSQYFKNFIGCTDQTSAQQSSDAFKRAFLDYLLELDLDKQTQEGLRKDVYSYCDFQISRNEDISLHRISSMINPDEPELFQEFAASEKYSVSPLIKGHKKTLNLLNFYSYHTKELTIQFARKLKDETVFYDEKTNELRIKNVPDKLKRQLTSTEDEE